MQRKLGAEDRQVPAGNANIFIPAISAEMNLLLRIVDALPIVRTYVKDATENVHLILALSISHLNASE